MNEAVNSSLMKLPAGILDSFPIVKLNLSLKWQMKTRGVDFAEKLK